MSPYYEVLLLSKTTKPPLLLPFQEVTSLYSAGKLLHFPLPAHTSLPRPPPPKICLKSVYHQAQENQSLYFSHKTQSLACYLFFLPSTLLANLPPPTASSFFLAGSFTCPPGLRAPCCAGTGARDPGEKVFGVRWRQARLWGRGFWGAKPEAEAKPASSCTAWLPGPSPTHNSLERAGRSPCLKEHRLCNKTCPYSPLPGHVTSSFPIAASSILTWEK